MYQYASNCAACAFEAIGIPGVDCKVIYENESQGRKTVVTKMAPGATIPRHHHTNVDETVYVLEGAMVEDGENYGPGSYFFGAAGTEHGPHKTEQGCLLLTHWTGGAVDFIVTD